MRNSFLALFLWCLLSPSVLGIKQARRKLHNHLYNDSFFSHLPSHQHTHSLFREVEEENNETLEEQRKRRLQSKVVMREKLEKFHHHNAQTVGFYHVFADTDQNYKRIVREQTDHIQHSGLLKQVDMIFYNTIRDDFNISTLLSPSSAIHSNKYVHLSHLGETGEEAETVSALYEYCHNHPKAKVFYFHDKGSFHTNYLNERFRHYLNCYVLNPQCITALDEYDTCGMRASPTPFIHYSGNFWWAKCSYVNTLIDPLSYDTNATFAKLTSHMTGCIGTERRYFIESWIGSGPVIKPADCIPADVDNSYLYGYIFPPAFAEKCPDMSYGNNVDVNTVDTPLPVGLPCSAADTWKHAEKFHDGYDGIRERESKECALTNLPKAVTERTLAWYGQIPEFYLDWMNRIVRMRNITDGTPIRGIREVQCYYYKDNEIHAINSAGALFKLGKSFDDIVVVPTYQIPLFKRGADVPN